MHGEIVRVSDEVAPLPVLGQRMRLAALGSRPPAGLARQVEVIAHWVTISNWRPVFAGVRRRRINVLVLSERLSVSVL